MDSLPFAHDNDETLATQSDLWQDTTWMHQLLQNEGPPSSTAAASAANASAAKAAEPAPADEKTPAVETALWLHSIRAVSTRA